MIQFKSWDLIYLNKCQSDLVNDWVYYRVRSDGGNLYDPISVCKVKWPTFEDENLIWDEKRAVVTTPGLVGLASAYEQMCVLMKNLWGIDHEQSILIGSLFKEA